MDGILLFNGILLGKEGDFLLLDDKAGMKSTYMKT